MFITKDMKLLRLPASSRGFDIAGRPCTLTNSFSNSLSPKVLEVVMRGLLVPIRTELIVSMVSFSSRQLYAYLLKS